MRKASYLKPSFSAVPSPTKTWVVSPNKKSLPAFRCSAWHLGHTAWKATTAVVYSHVRGPVKFRRLHQSWSYQKTTFPPLRQRHSTDSNCQLWDLSTWPQGWNRTFSSWNFSNIGPNMAFNVCTSLIYQYNYTSKDPKQQQTMFPWRSCAIKNSLGIPFLRKETKEKKGVGDKPRNPSPEPEGARKPGWNTILFLRKERNEK